MNKKIKKLWVEALRSGQYRKGVGALKKVIKKKSYYCCLGVLCDIHKKITKSYKWEKEAHDNDLRTYLDNYAYLPEEVCQWANIKNEPALSNGDSLINLNDDDNFSFRQIADKIEKDLEL
jgi:hypothetical protein